ncbi:RNA-directed DNA polymerase [Abeliophyllum distichum]|uniref:RNA-directed DNA polymerase n=1 Tax=Abeliophyllum distichum TaxID=126358 RepID=A0ABD1V579_9LAMI
MLGELQTQLHRAQQCMKIGTDKHRREMELSVGERVYLKLRPYRQKTVAAQANQKLAPRYYGPFEVIGHVGKVAYRLRLPNNTSIHPVFYTSQLRKAIGENHITRPLPSQLGEDIGRVCFCWRLHGNLFDMFVKHFPSFHLEDKVAFLGSGIDRMQRPEVRFPYARRKQNQELKRNRSSETSN